MFLIATVKGLQVNLGSSIYQVSRNMNQPQMSSSHSDVLGGVQQVKAEKFEREPIILDIVRTPPLRVRVVHCDSRMQKILYFSHL